MKLRSSIGGVVAAGLLATVALSACSSPKESAESPESGSANAPATDGQAITVWVDQERLPALKELQSWYEEETGVKVELVLKDFATLDQDFISQVPTGNGPDIVVSPHNVLGAYVLNGVVAPVELGDKRDEFMETAVQAITYEGNTWGVPYCIENIALLRNTDLAPEVAADFDQVIENGEAAVAAGAEFPFLVGLDPKQADPYHLYPLQTSFGSEVFAQNADGTFNPDELTLGNPEGIAFAEALSGWAARGIVDADITGDIALDAFTSGKSPYYLTGPWNLPTIRESGIPYAVDPLPSAGGFEARPFSGVNAFFISSKSENKVAATKFLVDYVGSERGQKALYESGGRPPAMKVVYDEVAATDPDIKALGAIGKNAIPMPAIPQMAAVWSDWGGAEMAIIRGAEDPAAVWTAAVESIRAKLED